MVGNITHPLHPDKCSSYQAMSVHEVSKTRINIIGLALHRFYLEQHGDEFFIVDISITIKISFWHELLIITFLFHVDVQLAKTALLDRMLKP
jgi:hypothetical protein